jgi:hypothetical protein
MAFTASTWGQGRLLTGLSPGSSLSGFRAIITKDNLPTSALDTGPLSGLNGGGDFYFATDINGANQLPAQIVTCVTNATAGNTEFEARIRFPTYASGTRSVYAFWNKSGQSQPIPSAAFGQYAVWTDNLDSWINADTTGDSSTGGDDIVFSSTPTIIESINGGGAVLIASGENGLSAPLNTAGDYTFSLWFKRTGNMSSGKAVADTRVGGANSYGIKLNVDSADSISIAIVNTSVVYPIDPTKAVVPLNTWCKLEVAIPIGSGTTSIYFNGSLLGSGATDRTVIDKGVRLSDSNMLIDMGYGLTEMYDGMKSADLVSSEYSVQDSPSTFWTAGAVFVPGGGTTITVPTTLGTISYTSQATDVSVTGTVNVAATLGTISYSSNSAVVAVTGGIDVVSTLGTIGYTSNNTTVAVTGTVGVSASLGTISYSSNNALVSVGGIIAVQPTLGTITYASNNVTVGLAGTIQVAATVGTISYSSNNAQVLLTGLIDVNATLGTISYTSNNTTVVVQAGQAFGVVTAGFADDLYNSNFKPNSITVNFKG